jgi:phage-related protein
MIIFKLMRKKFEIFFYEVGGRKPPEKFLFSLPEKAIAKTLRIIDLLEIYGPIVGMPYVKKVESNIYELRITGRENVRFFFTVQEKIITILHGFKKKSQKLPRKEINIAQKRLTRI